jgi:hypothetical protein
MAGSEGSTKPTMRGHVFGMEAEAHATGPERAPTKPDVEGYAEGALRCQGGEHGPMRAGDDCKF